MSWSKVQASHISALEAQIQALQARVAKLELAARDAEARDQAKLKK